jgi:hypothetical protein
MKEGARILASDVQGSGSRTVCACQDHAPVSRIRSNYRAVRSRAEPTKLKGSVDFASPTNTTRRPLRIGSKQALASLTAGGGSPERQVKPRRRRFNCLPGCAAAPGW